jgi:hypothetical protein
MAKVERGKREIPRGDFDRQFAAASRRGKEASQEGATAVRAYYDDRARRIVIEMKNGAVLMIPCALIQGLAAARAADLFRIEIGPMGTSLRWPSLDEDYSIAGFLAGFFGSQSWMAELGRRGGSVKSRRKSISSRKNGKKGGRPRKIA